MPYFARNPNVLLSGISLTVLAFLCVTMAISNGPMGAACQLTERHWSKKKEKKEEPHWFSADVEESWRGQLISTAVMLSTTVYYMPLSLAIPVLL